MKKFQETGFFSEEEYKENDEKHRNVTSLDEFKRIVSGWLKSYDMSCYAIAFDSFVDKVSYELLAEAKSDWFEWGDDMPEFSNEVMSRITKKYELQE